MSLSIEEIKNLYKHNIIDLSEDEINDIYQRLVPKKTDFSEDKKLNSYYRLAYGSDVKLDEFSMFHCEKIYEFENFLNFDTDLTGEQCMEIYASLKNLSKTENLWICDELVGNLPTDDEDIIIKYLQNNIDFYLKKFRRILHILQLNCENIVS